MHTCMHTYTMYVLGLSRIYIVCITNPFLIVCLTQLSSLSFGEFASRASQIPTALMYAYIYAIYIICILSIWFIYISNATLSCRFHAPLDIREGFACRHTYTLYIYFTYFIYGVYTYLTQQPLSLRWGEFALRASQIPTMLKYAYMHESG